MLSYMSLALVAFSVYWVGSGYRQFRINLAAAKQSGLPYVCIPWHNFHRFWLVTHLLILPILKMLPAFLTKPWLDYMAPGFIWDEKHDCFRKLGADCFILVSPSKNTMYVADAAAVAQITTRRNDFPKPLEMYGSLDIFGKNVVTTEGQNWRHHRKITSPPFSEKNNRMVWLESLYQAESLMTGIVGKGGQDAGKPVQNIASLTMRLSLHVISRAGFGVRPNWPHEEDTVIPQGHTMSYTAALSTLLENIVPVLLTPQFILDYSPLEVHKSSGESYREWGMYMREMYEAKRAKVKNSAGDDDDGMDLMGALVKGAGITRESLNDDSKSGSAKQMLTDDEILGNAFVFILAGHETAANTLHFAMLYLALQWSTQKHLQDELDDIFGDKPVTEWSFEDDLPKLFGGMCGAIMNEELRLLPPVVGIPKSTTALKPEGLVLDGKHVTVPAGCYVTLDTIALHRNPKYWPHTSLEDLEAFRPERWLVDNASAEAPAEDEEEDFDGGAGPDKRADTAASLFRPIKGAYIPFSDGYRSCLGRRFAQVEILAVLAVVFKYWTVELDVSMFLNEGEDVAAMNATARRAVWDKAEARARDLLKNGLATVITLQMRKGHVPLRFVKRGQEQFAYA